MFKIGLTDYDLKELPWHAHKSYEVIAYIRGQGTMRTSAGDMTVQSGDILIVPPGIFHSTVSGEELQSLHISGEFGGVFRFERPVLLTDNDEGEGMSLVRMIYRNRYENREYVAALCNALTHFLLQNLKTEASIEFAVRNLIYAITANFHDTGIDLNALLNQSGYAEDYIRAHFKKNTGKTPTAFLHTLRIERASYLIEVYHSTRSLSEIAMQCGYTDYVLFSKRFKMIKGVSPQRYKQEFEELSQ